VDHVGAELAQQLRRPRPDARERDVEDADSIEWLRHVRVPPRAPRSRARVVAIICTRRAPPGTARCPAIALRVQPSRAPRYFGGGASRNARAATRQPTPKA